MFTNYPFLVLGASTTSSGTRVVSCRLNMDCLSRPPLQISQTIKCHWCILAPRVGPSPPGRTIPQNQLCSHHLVRLPHQGKHPSTQSGSEVAERLGFKQCMVLTRGIRLQSPAPRTIQQPCRSADDLRTPQCAVRCESVRHELF